MTAYRLYRRRDYKRTAIDLPRLVQRKADWAQVQLGARGRTPTVKGTSGLNAAWRRSPVQGSHYYLWWIPADEGGLNGELNGGTEPRRDGAQERPRHGKEPPAPAILVHSIRHHDETDRPIEIGAPADYEPVDIDFLDPRFEEQAAVGEAVKATPGTFAVLEGMPGSGKSVALIFLARDLAFEGLRKIRYITYSERLKNATREIVRALHPEIAGHITVHTVNDILRELLKADLRSNPYDELNAFLRDLENIPPRDLGPWRSHPFTLYTELRAHIVGRTFPSGYQLPKHRDEQLRRRGGAIDVERYARARKLDPRSAELAVALADRLRPRYFADQQLAARALERLAAGENSNWLAHSDAFIVDEVQDLTLLQIALLGEMAHLRRLRYPERPFSLTIAGDESQIVQPTGFKWGVTKDLLADRLDVHPVQFHYEEQRRSPPLLARLVQGSWNLYSLLPKELRPSAAQTVRADAPAADPSDVEPGLILLTPPPATAPAPESVADPAEWVALLRELAARPGRALIDLTESLAASLDGAPRPAQETRTETRTEVLFAAREIKGLERSTILVHGLNALYTRITDLLHDAEGDAIPQMEARRLIDQMRVALSRSTSRLVLLEAPDAPVFTALEFDPATAVTLALPDLVEFLRSEDMTEVEMVHGLLDEAEELAERGRREEALQRNARAQMLAARLVSPSLARQVDAQHARLALEQGEALLRAGQVAAAQAVFETLAPLAGLLEDEADRTRLAELESRLGDASDVEFDRLLAQSARAQEAGDLAVAVAAAEQALALAGRTQSPERPPRARMRAVEAKGRWAAVQAAEQDAALSPQIASLLRDAAALLHEESSATREMPRETPREMPREGPQEPADAARAAVLTALARRYEECPARRALAYEQQRLVLEATRTVLAALENSHLPDPDGAPWHGARMDALTHLRLWLDETFADLGDRTSLYYSWATLAYTLAGLHAYSTLDEQIWELENRLELSGAQDPSAARFRAFLADYNGDPSGASLLWERLGDTDQAIAGARAAGELERAYRLIQSNRSAQMPEALSTAVKALRLLQQLQQKQQHLTDAERRALLEEIARLHTVLTEQRSAEPE